MISTEQWRAAIGCFVPCARYKINPGKQKAASVARYKINPEKQKAASIAKYIKKSEQLKSIFKTNYAENKKEHM